MLRISWSWVEVPLLVGVCSMAGNRTESLQIVPNHYKSIRTTTIRTESLQIVPNSTNRTEELSTIYKRCGCGGDGDHDDRRRRRRRRPIKTRGTGSTPTPINTSRVVLPCRSYPSYALHSTPAHQSHRHAIHSLHCQGRYSVHQYYCPSTRGDPFGPKLYGKYHPMIPIRLGN